MADGMGFDEVFVVCLEELRGGQGVAELLRRYPEHGQELKPLLETAAWFGGQAAALAPRPGFMNASRARLMQQIAAQPPAPVSRTWGQLFSGLGSTWRFALQAAVVVVMLVCLAVGSSGIAYASQTALPGDALYPVKLALEKVELLVTLDPQAQLRLHVEFSQLRLAEMQRLLALGRYADLSIATANYRNHVSQALVLARTLAAQSPALGVELAAALRAQALHLGVLAGLAPQAPRVELEAAAQAALDGAQQADEIEHGIEIPPPADSTGGETVSNTPTQPPPATAAGYAIATSTPDDTPTLTPGPTQTRTSTPTATPTLTQTSLRTVTATVTPDRTVIPTATRTTRPTATRTGQPTPTRTTQPTPTRTGQPTPTRTTQPTPTRTGQPTPTRTLQPSPTATLPSRTPTATDIPPTSTLPPTPTRTPLPTHTNTPEPTPYPGIYPPP
jgi:hypothetical protein